MSDNRARVPQKRERDAIKDAEQSRTLARKAVKLSDNSDAASALKAQSTKQTPDMLNGRPRPDSETVPLNASLQSLLSWQKAYDARRPRLFPAPIDDRSSHKAASSEGTVRPKTEAEGDEQHGDHSEGQHEDLTEVTEITSQSGSHKDPSSSCWSKSTSGEESRGIEERVGDLFDAPDDVVLVHACNTQGSWGAGIAKEFRKRYPKAFSLYRQHCLITHHPKSNQVPTGSCLLIPPVEGRARARRHWIACLFTSEKYGGHKDSQGRILANTSPALRHLLALVRRQAGNTGPHIQEIRMCQINSGLFAVKWEHTKTVLEGTLESDTDHPPVFVYSQATAPSAPNAVQKKVQKGQTTLQAFIQRHWDDLTLSRRTMRAWTEAQRRMVVSALEREVLYV